MTPERLAELIPITLAKLYPPAIESRPGNPIALCQWLNRYTTENPGSRGPKPLGPLWPQAPHINANHYSLAEAPQLPLLVTTDCGPVQFCNQPGANSAGQPVPLLEKCQRVADHVIAFNGEVAFSRSDFTLPGPIPFRWQRYYRQGNREDGGLGPGWRHSLSEQLQVIDGNSAGVGNPASRVELHTAEGRVVTFSLPPIGHSCYNRFERLLLRRQSLHSYRLSGFNQPEKIFRADGTSSALPLAEIRDRFGNALTIDYQQGRPVKIVSSWGRVLDFEYRGQSIEKILNRHAPAEDQVLCTYAYGEESGYLSSARAGRAREDYRYGEEAISAICGNTSGTIEFSYDNRQRCHAVRRNRLELRLSWRLAQRRCTLKVADHHPTSWKFSEYGQLLQELQGDRSLTHLYDHYGNLCQTTAADGQRDIYRYDEFGRMVRHTRNGISDRYLYDERGQLVAALKSGEQRWLIDYAERSLPERITDPSGHRWQLQYNDRGQLTLLTDPEKGKVELSWDSQGQLLSVQRTDRQWSFAYDYWHRLTACTLDGETTQQWRYDACGALLEFQAGEDILHLDSDPQGRPSGLNQNGQPVLLWQRDDWGNIRLIHRAGGCRWQITYDQHDRIIRAQNSANTLEWQYDAFGRVAEYTDAQGDRKQWQYDHSANVRELRDNDTHWYFAYSDSGALRQIRNNSGQQCDFHFDALGRLAQADNGHSRVRFQYDSRNLLVAEHHHASDSEGLSINHQYDGRGWLKRSTSDDLDLNYLLAPDAGLYGIDANGEAVLRCETLEREEHWSQGENHSRHYYRLGRLARIETAENLSWNFERTEGMSALLPPAPLAGSPAAMERDMRGNIIREQRDDRQRREYLYQYDGWGLLTSAECGDFKTYFRYDPFARRLSKLSTHRKSTRQRRVNYSHYGGGLWCERSQVDDAAQPATHYLYHPLRGTLLSRWQAGTLEHYLVDPNGAPLALFDHCGGLLWPAPENAPDRQQRGCGPWRGAGQIADSETGLLYSWRGYWHPLHNCWLQRQDPLDTRCDAAESGEDGELAAPLPELT